MKTLKVGLDIGNSAVKGSILSEHNGLIISVSSRFAPFFLLYHK